MIQLILWIIIKDKNINIFFLEITGYSLIITWTVRAYKRKAPAKKSQKVELPIYTQNVCKKDLKQKIYFLRVQILPHSSFFFADSYQIRINLHTSNKQMHAEPNPNRTPSRHQNLFSGCTFCSLLLFCCLFKIFRMPFSDLCSWHFHTQCSPSVWSSAPNENWSFFQTSSDS